MISIFISDDIFNILKDQSCSDDNDVFLKFSIYFLYAFLLINPLSQVFYVIKYISNRYNIDIPTLFRLIGRSNNRNIHSNNENRVVAHNIPSFFDYNNGNRVVPPNVNYMNMDNFGLNYDEMNRLKQCNFDINDKTLKNKACSICIADFIDKENVNKLPKCDHLFLIECI